MEPAEERYLWHSSIVNGVGKLSGRPELAEATLENDPYEHYREDDRVPRW